MYDPLAEEEGATLYDRPRGQCRSFGHRQLLAQAISNLIENAVRYARGSEIRVSSARSSAVRIEVADEAPESPLSLEVRHGSARPSDASRSKEGAGLGLALAAAIAHLHKGELSLEDNQPGFARRCKVRPVGRDAERRRNAATGDHRQSAKSASTSRSFVAATWSQLQFQRRSVPWHSTDIFVSMTRLDRG